MDLNSMVKKNYVLKLRKHIVVERQTLFRSNRCGSNSVCVWTRRTPLRRDATAWFANIFFSLNKLFNSTFSLVSKANGQLSPFVTTTNERPLGLMSRTQQTYVSTVVRAITYVSTVVRTILPSYNTHPSIHPSIHPSVFNAGPFSSVCFLVFFLRPYPTLLYCCYSLLQAMTLFVYLRAFSVSVKK